MELSWSDLTEAEKDALRLAWTSGELQERMSVAHRKADDKKDVLAENLENAVAFLQNGDFDGLSEIPREVVVQLLTDDQRANEYETGSLEVPDRSRIEELRNETLSLRTIGRARPFAYARDELICVAAEIYATRGGHVAQFNPSYPPGAHRPATKTAVARASGLSAYASAVGRFLVSVLKQFEAGYDNEEAIATVAQALRRLAARRPDLFPARRKKGD